MPRSPAHPPSTQVELGLQPHLLADAMIDSLLDFAVQYKDRVR